MRYLVDFSAFKSIKNLILFEDDYCLLPVTFKSELFWAKVDIEDAIWACKHSWCIRGKTSFYSVSKFKGKIKQLHSLVSQTPKGMDTDHINHDTLDNRKSNLRIATRNQNSSNRSGQPNTSSKYKGVSKRKDNGRWQASITSNHQRFALGCFLSELEAAKAYDKAARKFFKEYAYLNFPDIKDD